MYTKIKLNMGKSTLEDINSVRRICPNKSKTSIVALALRFYKEMLIKQNVENKEILVEDLCGNRTLLKLN